MVEIISNCHVQFGRRNEMPEPVTMMNWFKNSAVPVEKASDMSTEELAGRIPIGILTDIEKPNYLKKYELVRERAAKNNKKG